MSKDLQSSFKQAESKQIHKDLAAKMVAKDASNDQADDFSESSSLIIQLGRDMSINCLAHCSRSDYGTIASLNRAFRSLIRSGQIYRLRQERGIVEHWVYYSCNLTEWEAFDPIRHRWMNLPRVKTSYCFMLSCKESLAVGTELLVFGKEEKCDAIYYKYSLLTSTWSKGLMVSTPRYLFGSASRGEIAILAGGCDDRGNILRSAVLYNSVTGVWAPIPSMHRARKLCSGAFMEGKFYAIGGIGEGGTLSTSVEMYDLETKKWTEIANMWPARASAAEGSPPLVAVVKNELYAADYELHEVMKYDKGRNLWNNLGRLPERASSTCGWGLAFRACGDQLIVIGGPRALGTEIIEVNGWVPVDDGPPVWNLLARKRSFSFVYNSAVMGC